ncbi:cytochrome c [Herbaspirillum sp. AP02]|jgi:cytochrome c553|uniref:Periplasmic cytochrome c553 protein n=1 Tax=Herbaspirillum frisingense GSF30 TaxID=864073 RepID=A0AAI9IA43_9BURK|nr:MULTISPECIES: cytochrome c [Herbaspirillum]EOA02371.1 periplasmic cytochrome c553 protein [Herbaspirillum frisingense GSF30]MBG7618844.1 cytochrome c [Herbaspirillum sp. AP02]NZD67354.1 cytochrome c [Herbaspirillum sp. AP21]ONN68215.1 cytochrome C [Herbaspirillum sp. VT-16-41]
MNNKLIALALLAAATLLSQAATAADIANGRALMEKYNCASCHGKDYTSPTDPAYPKLAGQHEDYIKHALTAYRRGDSAMNGRNNAIMSPLAKPLSDRDIADIAAFLHSLPGTLVLRK